MKKYRKIILIACSALVCLTLCGCQKKETVSPYANIPNPIATVTMEDGGVMRFVLYPAYAPNTVCNFVTLANSGYYDGLCVDFVFPTYLIRAGCPNGDGFGGPDYTIAGEFAKNGYSGNTLSHRRGVISMCHLENDYNSAGSQFFVMQSTHLEYDGEYAAFGAIAEGDADSLLTLDTIAGTGLDKNYKPMVKLMIQSIRVDTMGYEYEVIPFAGYGAEEP